MKGDYAFHSCRLAYRSIREEDAGILVLWRSDSRIIKYYRSQKPLTEQEHLAWYRDRYLEDASRLDMLVLDGQVPVGFAALVHMDFDAGAAEINYTIGNMDYTGRGLGREMINAVCRFGYGEFGISKFRAVIHKENHASRRAAQSAGFVPARLEGIFLDYRKEISGCHLT